MPAVNFDNIPERYSQRANKLEYVRVQVLGIERPDFKAAGEKLIQVSFSTETLRKIEREDGGSETTRTKVLRSLNAQLKAEGFDPLTREQLYSPFQ